MKDANGKELKAGDYIVDSTPSCPFRIVSVNNDIALVTIFDIDEEAINITQSEIIERNWVICDSKGVII